MDYPKSESTLKRHKYSFNLFERGTDGVISNKIVKYINDLGYPCLYRVEIDGIDTKERVQYYGGKLLQIMTTN